MAGPFDPPPGDAGRVATAAQALGRVSGDLSSYGMQAAGAVGLSLLEWQAPRADDFRHAGAGIQIELASAADAARTAGALLAAYAAALADTTAHVAALRRQDEAGQAGVDQATRGLKPDDPRLDGRLQQAARRHSQLVAQALTAKADLAALAARTAAGIDAETDLAVPGGSTLSPQQIRRRVDEGMGATRLAAGPLNTERAWDALRTARLAAPDDAITAEGGVDWTKALAEFNDKVLGQPVSAGAIGTTPSAGWALWQLVANQRSVAQIVRDMPGTFSEIVGPTMLEFDRGLAGWKEVNDALIEFNQVKQAVYALGPESEAPEAFARAAAGGLPETGWLGAASKGLAGVAVVSDVFTIVDPGVENPTEGTALRVAAGANILGTGAAFGGATVAGLVGLNAATDWIPVVGEVVMVGTGLFLAGDYLYHHWDETTHFVTTTVPDALGSAADAAGDALSSAGHAVADFIGGLF